MTEVNPPFVLQASSHPAASFRRVLEFVLGGRGDTGSATGQGGVRTAADLAVTANGTPNMSVNVAAGEAVVVGSESQLIQGAYHVYNDATKNLTIAASDPTNPRIDIVVAKVQDAEYSGATNAWSLAVVTGTPAASPAVPATPANAIVLAQIAVAASVTTIVSGNITDRRFRATGLGARVTCTSTTRPAAPSAGDTIYETDTGKVQMWNGTAAWIELDAVMRVAASSWTAATALTSVASFVLQPGVWDIRAKGYFDVSTATARSYTAELYNLTSTTSLDQTLTQAGTTAKLPYALEEAISLSAAATIQLRLAASVLDGTQLHAQGKMFAVARGRLG